MTASGTLASGTLAAPTTLMEFFLKLPTRVTAGVGSFDSLGALAASHEFRRTLLVADRGIVKAGFAARAESLLAAAGIEVFAFDDIEANPDASVVDLGAR